LVAPLIAAVIAALDMNAWGGRSKEAVALTRLSERVTGASLRSADTVDGILLASGARSEAAGSPLSTPRVTTDAVARTASGPMMAWALGLRRASVSRLWR
jgi:hypothetical protein